MSSISQKLQALDASIAAINAQITALSSQQSTAAEAPEVLRFFIEGDQTEFVGPDRIANAIAQLSSSLIKLMDRRDKLAQGQRTGVRRTGVSQ